MKQLTSYNRVAGYLNKLFDLLNQRFFESALSRPTITIQSTPRAYGHFSMRDDTWVSVTGSSNEINIGAGTLARPIENVCATLLHEMVHYYCHVNGIKDTSRGNTYHNKRFKEIAESHGLTVNHHEKYGWTITEPNDELLTFVLENDLSDILITRNEFYGVSVSGTGTHSNTPPLPSKPSSSRKYICPCCGNSVRATKSVHIACLDCKEPMILASRDSIRNYYRFPFSEQRKAGGLSLYPEAAANDSEREKIIKYLIEQRVLSLTGTIQ